MLRKTDVYKRQLLALQAEDDDGNGASKASKPKLTAAQLSKTLASNDLNAVKKVYDSFALDADEKKLIFQRITELTAN